MPPMQGLPDAGLPVDRNGPPLTILSGSVRVQTPPFGYICTKRAAIDRNGPCADRPANGRRGTSCDYPAAIGRQARSAAADSGLTGSGTAGDSTAHCNRGSRIEHRRGHRHGCRDSRCRRSDRGRRRLSEPKPPQAARPCSRLVPSPPLAKASAATRTASVPAANVYGRFPDAALGGSCRRTARALSRRLAPRPEHRPTMGRWPPRRQPRPDHSPASENPDDGGTGRPRHRRWRTGLAVGTSLLTDCNRCRDASRRRPVRHRRLPPSRPRTTHRPPRDPLRRPHRWRPSWCRWGICPMARSG